MIVYLQEHDATLEVPDDIGDADLADIQANFHAYTGAPESAAKPAPLPAAPEAPAEPAAAALDLAGPRLEAPDAAIIAPPETPEEPAKAESDKWTPNFYESFIRPNLPALTGPAALAIQAGETSERRAFTGKAAEEFTFGLTKPIADPMLSDDYKQHPVYAGLGQVAGGLGSLLTVGGALKIAGLPVLAKEAGAAAAASVAAAPRFLPRAIMTGATFGTQTFVKETVKAFQDGNVDIVDFGASVIKNTAFGAVGGAVSGLASAPTAVVSAAGLGYIAAKTEGADDTEALLNASIWAAFELVGAVGREAKLRKEALDTLGDSIGEYVKAKDPKVSPEQARAVGRAVVQQAANRVGGVEAVVNGEKGEALQVIESINQQVRQGKVKGPIAAPKAVEGPAAAPAAPVKPAEIPAPAAPAAPAQPASAPAAAAEPKAPAPAPEGQYQVQTNSDLKIIIKRDGDGWGYDVGGGMKVSKETYPNSALAEVAAIDEVLAANEKKKGDAYYRIKDEFGMLRDDAEQRAKAFAKTTPKEKTVKVDKSGVPVRKPKSVVSTVQNPDGETVKITHKMVLDRAVEMRDEELARVETESFDPIRDVIFSKKLKPEEGRDGEWKDLPFHVKDPKKGWTAEQIAEYINEEPERFGLEQGQVLTGADIYEYAQRKARGQVGALGTFYEEARRELEYFFSNHLPGEIGTEVEPGVFFDTPGELLTAAKESLTDRYERLRKQAMENGMNPAQASKWAQSRMKGEPEAPRAPAAKQQEFGAGDGVSGFGQGRQGEQELFFDRPEPTAPKQTDTPEFKKWFGDSKVVDKDGNPLVVYHGTWKPGFTEFKGAAYFTDASDYAETYAGADAGMPGAIIPAFLKIERPLDLRELGEKQIGWKAFTKRLQEKGINIPVEIAEVIQGVISGPPWEYMRKISDVAPGWLSKTGFDGIIQKEYRNDVYLIPLPEEISRKIVKELPDDAEFFKQSSDLFFVRVPSISSQYIGSGKTKSEARANALSALNDRIINGSFQIKSAIGNRGTFDPGNPDILYDRPQSSKGAYGREFGDDKDRIASLHKKLGGLEFIKKMQGPELVKFARSISGEVPVIKKMMAAFGYFRPSDEQIGLRKDIFKDPKFWEAVLAHEIGHLMDFNPDKTMNRGNILGRIASLRSYRKTLLPEAPDSPEQILTDKDRARFRRMAEEMAMGEASGGSIANEPDNQFDPQAILDVWNSITENIDPDLLAYVKGLDVNQKKALIKSAMAAIKKGEKITLYDVRKFNKDAARSPQSVSEIYRDILKAEIRKRKLWEEEVIREEFKALSQFWKPFNDTLDPAYTKYRYSSAELYADFVSVLLNAPAKAKEIAPNGYRAFFNYLENKPEVMTNLLELQNLIQGDDADLQKVRAQDILEMFDRGEQAFRARQLNLEKAQKSMYFKLKTLFVDKNWALLEQREKLAAREPIAPSRDAKYAIERNAMVGAVIKSHLEDFDRLVYQPSKDEELVDAVKTMLFLDRVGADREEMANPLGHTPETAKAILDAMQKEDPAKFARASELAQAARNWFRDLAQIPGGEHFFTPEQFSLMAMNDKYAPFRVVDFMKDYVSAGFSQQHGTLKDIGDPLTSLAMKGVSVVQAIERNLAKKTAGEMLLRSGVEMRPVEVINYPGVFKIPDPQESHLGTLAWKSGGKWVAYHVDRFIAEAFNSPYSSQMGLIGATFNLLLNNSLFRNMFVVFNATFQAKNLIKDFMRTWRNSPGLTIAKALRLYAESLPEAKKRAKGDFDPLIQEMERSGALQLTFNDLILGRNAEDAELEAVLEKYDLVETTSRSFDKTPVMKNVVQVLDWLRYVGDAIETLPKVAGYKALEHLTPEERAYRVRNLIGTPNPKRTGSATPVTNALFLFSNVWIQGLRGMIEAALEPGRKGEYWRKMVYGTVLPKAIMAAAAAGAFGVGVKEVMDKVSDYNKTNNIVIPIGVDEDGNGIAIRFPQDEESRLIGAIFWRLLNHRGNLLKNFGEIISPPSVAPLFEVAGAWGDFLSGENPRDNFRAQDILTDDEHAAGGLDAFEPMARWTLNQTGFFRLDIRDRIKNEPIHKAVVTSIPILQSFILVTRTGERERINDEVKKVKEAEAEERLALREAARDAIRAGKTVEELIDEADPQTSDELRKIQSTYEKSKNKVTNDPAVQAVISATSTAQKVAALKAVRGRYMTEAEFDEFIDELYIGRIISPEVANLVRQ